MGRIKYTEEFRIEAVNYLLKMDIVSGKQL